MKNMIWGILVISMISLFGCTGGGVEGSGGAEPQEPTTVRGAIQKGPFVIGSSVVVSFLNSDGTTTTNNIQTQTTDSIGNFSFAAEQGGPAQIQAKGYHINEITGELSSGELTLRAIYNISSDDGQAAFVNILTHLIHNRVLALMADNIDVDTAITQAQNELLEELSPVLDKPSNLLFTSLSVYNVEGSDTENNDYLLALSALAYQHAMTASEENSSSVDAELTSLLNNLSSDIADNGKIDQSEYTENLNQAKIKINKEEIESNLERAAIAATGEVIAIPDITGFLVGMLITSPADQATITNETIIRTLFSDSLSLSDETLLIDGVLVEDNIEDLSNYSWNPYFWGDNNQHSIIFTAKHDGTEEVISNLISVEVSDTVKQLLIPISPGYGDVFNQTNQVQLRWQPLDNATNYEVQITTDHNFLTDIKTYQTSETSIAITNLDTTSYYWRIRATNGIQWGPATTSQLFVINKPELPDLNIAEITKQEIGYDIFLSWEDMGEDNSYSVYLKDMATDTVIEETTSENEITISNLEIGRYEWQIKRTNSLGQESELSAPQGIDAGIFTKYYGGSGDDRAKQILKSVNGGYIVLASTKSPEISATAGSEADDWIFKIGSEGNMIWQYVSSANGRDRFKQIAEMSDGSIVAVGNDWDSDKAIAVKLSSNGEELWEVLYRPSDITERYDFEGVIEFNNAILTLGVKRENSTRSYYLHEISTDANLVSAPIDIPTPQIQNLESFDISKLGLTSSNNIIIAGTGNIEGGDFHYNEVAYFQILDANLVPIITWNDIEKRVHINVGDTIELSNGSFALIGQHPGGGFPSISVIDKEGKRNMIDTDFNLFYNKQLIVAESDGGFYGFFQDYSTNYDNAMTLISFSSNFIANKEISYTSFKEYSDPVGLTLNDDSFSFILNEPQIGSTSHDIIIFKRGKNDLAF